MITAQILETMSEVLQRKAMFELSLAAVRIELVTGQLLSRVVAN